MIYSPRAKLELLKYNGGEKKWVAWFNKVEEYLYIYNNVIYEEKINMPPGIYKGMHSTGTCIQRIKLVLWLESIQKQFL